MLDGLVLGLVILFALLGLLAGFVLQVLRLGVTAASAAVALYFAAPLMAALPNVLQAQPAAREILAHFALFTACYLVLDVAARLVAAALRTAAGPLSVLDRLAGVLMGAVKGAVLAYFLVSVILATEASSGGRYARLETGRSMAASWVRSWPVGRLADLAHLQALKDLDVDIVLPGADSPK
jgi:uncharacterized membrane protein required for colicin V production